MLEILTKKEIAERQEKAIQEFLAKGGVIQTMKPKKVKKKINAVNWR